MAPKKKKAVSNPARGFATTSIASKSKTVPKDETTAESSVVEKAEDTSTAAPSSATGTQSQSKELHQLTPEELEIELEKNDLQSLVDSLGPKVHKESARQLSRIQTERRTLRNQSQELYVKDWMSERLVTQVLDIVRPEIRNDRGTSEQIQSLKSSSEEDLVNRFWTLSETLLAFGIPSDRVDDLLKALVAHPSSTDGSGQIWGFQDSVDMLALDCAEKDLPPFESDRLKPGFTSAQVTPAITPAQSTSATPKRGTSPMKGDVSRSPMALNASRPTIPMSSDDDMSVSDLGSDVEPDELLSIYLSTKTRLYSLRPGLASDSTSKTRGGKQNKQARLGPEENQPLSAGVIKLQKKLKQIESDILFDPREADAQWSERRIQLAQEAASRKRFALADDGSGSRQRSPKPSKSLNDVRKSKELGENAGSDTPLTEDDGGDDELLGGMFSTMQEDYGTASPRNGDDGESPSVAVTIRDFGKFVGISPRRVLEEACRSRDSSVKIAYHQVSPTTYSCRHSINITWAKDQEAVDNSLQPLVRADWLPRSTTITMIDIACPDAGQSEAYIATATLFLLFSTSSKDEKVYMRLPPIWRELWMEFLENKKEQSDAASREVVKSIRKIIHEQLEKEADEGIVLTSRFKKRIEAIGAKADDPSKGKVGVGLNDSSHRLMALWHAKQSTPAYQHMLQSRMNLPMFGFRAAALKAIEDNQVMILCGETGCGKSTQLPAFILEHELSKGKECKIYCTEPRRISAISLAQRVSEELGEQKRDLGTNRSLVGYAIRLESQVSASTRLVYATVGIVLRMLEFERGIDEISHLVIDEVHERSIDTDFLLVMLRSLLTRRPSLKVVLMSATVDADRFSRYLGGAPIITVPGRTFPVRALFLEDAVEITGHRPEGVGDEGDGDDEQDIDTSSSGKGVDMVSLGNYSPLTRNTLANYDEYRIDYELIVKLIERVAYDPAYAQFSNAVLVFLPGIAEIRQLNDILVGHPSFPAQGWRIYPLHSTIASDDQQQAFVVPPPGVRKIVIATNIAETGITIPDIVCVIDAGRHKEMRYDERRQISRLIQSFISKANAKQRRGRAGRVQEGICFHLFTKHRHDTLMAEQQTPEMLRLSLQELIMRVKICKLGDIEQTLSQALDPPSSKNIRRAIDALIEVGALTSKEELTPLGRQLSKLPLDAQLGKLCLLASIFGCLDMALTIAAILSSKTPFATPFGARKQAEAARMSFKKGDSDVLTAYNAYHAWRRVCTTPGQSEFQFCRKNYLNTQNLAGIEDLKSQLLSSLVDSEFASLSDDERAVMRKYRYASRQRTFVPVPTANNHNNENDLWTSAVLACAFYPKLLVRDGKGWRNVANNASVSLHPTSVNKGDMSIKYLSYYSIMQSSSRSPQAHSTTALPSPLPLLLLVGEADFKVHAGVVVLDSGRLRLRLRTWKSTIALKFLRRRAREIVDWHLTQPGKPLSPRLSKWMELIDQMFAREQKN